MISADDFKTMTFGERLDFFSSQIMSKGLQRPWWLYAWHFMIWATNYGGFAILAVLSPRPTDTSIEAHRRLIFVKFMVWQHLAEAVGCRQGPLGGHFALPNNWRFRLSVGTHKKAFLPCLGKKRNVIDFLVHSLFFTSALVFLLSGEYQYWWIRILCACDVWILCSDLTQFFGSTAHGYWTMLLSACFPVSEGQLAGIQLALIFQWFFSGIGKVGPWFGYVNGPFMLQSRLFGGQQWLFKLLVKSSEDLSPTMLGFCLGHTAAAVEYLAPLALMVPSNAIIWAGLVGLIAMHVYILVMPAPFDVYSWNTSYACCGLYLFYYSGVFGFDYKGLAAMNPWLAGALFCEFAVCWCGQFFPDKIGYYFSHRYWAGNWVQTWFFVKKSEQARSKFKAVRSFSKPPQYLPENEQTKGFQHMMNRGVYSALAYMWLGNLNMKCFVRLVHLALDAVGGTSMDEYDLFGVPAFFCGEFRDMLYADDALLHEFQADIGFDEGECIMVRVGSFGMGRQLATWKTYDMKRGVTNAGSMSRSALFCMDSLPSKSMDTSVALFSNAEGKGEALLAT